jgi:VWFA-related protein
MREPHRILHGIVAALFAFVGIADAQQSGIPAQAPVFRSGAKLILVDAIVRDARGALVSGLQGNDFQVLEDGKPQRLVTFAFEAIIDTVARVQSPSLLTRPVTSKGGAAPTNASVSPLTSETAAGHRLLTLLFDVSSMQPDDVQRSVDAALAWVDKAMSPADLVAIASVGSSLTILSDFSADKEQVRSVLETFSAASLAFGVVNSDTASSVATLSQATDVSDASGSDLDTFNNDVRLRALRTLCEALSPVQQKKAIIYFSSGMQRSGTDNQVELRSAVNAAVRANVAIYPVDSRGLQAIVPGGSARQESTGGLGGFSGASMATQFSSFAAQQETLSTLASDTGGTAFLDSNDFGEAFSRVATDISAYYILGYVSTNTEQDGRYRRITVRLVGNGKVKIDAREGYYADRDFSHLKKRDRELQLQEQLSADISSTDLPLFVASGWFRLAAHRYYVPISIAVPGTALPVSGTQGKLVLDIAGLVRDERSVPVGRVRDTVTVPVNSTEPLASRKILYQTSFSLPPGHFVLKAVVRESVTGATGSFEATIVVPDMRQSAVKVSSIVIGSQLRSVERRNASTPTVLDGVELVPNLTHIVGRNQPIYLHYEVYEPTPESGTSEIRTSVSFYRGKLKVFETPVVERSVLDVPDRGAIVFRLAIPPDSLTPGLYTCQVTVIDGVSGRFTFPRVEMFVR